MMERIKNPYDPYNPWDKEEDEADEYYRRAFENQPRVGLLTPRVPPKSPPPPPEPIPKVKDPVGPLRIRVVEDSTGKPIPNVKISFWNDDLPPLYTNDDGIAENLYAPGKTYIVECPPDKFTLTEISDFVGEGETPIHPTQSEDSESPEPESNASLTDKDKKSKSLTSNSRKPEYKIAHVIEYKVKTGDSFMTACRKGAGLIPMIGAYFNWGVRTNEEIQEKLRDYVGCTERDEDGDYILDDSNDPGIIYLYKKWEMTGVLINEMRTLRVRKIQPKSLMLHNVELQIVWDDSGKPVQNLPIVIENDGGETSVACADNCGIVRIDQARARSCKAQCSLEGVALEECVLFAGTGEKISTNKLTEDEKQESQTRMATPKAIVMCETRKVKSAETVESVAKEAGLVPEDLSYFNWKTREYKGLDDAEDAGIIYIPMQWSMKGLDRGQKHVIRVRPVRRGVCCRIRVRVDPKDSELKQYRFTLIGGNGLDNCVYKQTLDAETDALPHDEYVDLIFESLVPDVTYWLEVDPGNGEDKHYAFEELTWERLEPATFV